jgi:hypothetical protein
MITFFLKWLLPSFTGAGTVIAAALTAIPALIEAIGRTLKVIGESPVLSLLFGASLAGTVAFFYGLSFDAPLRAKYRAQAIAAANRQADIAIANAVKTANLRADQAIAKIRADYERQLRAQRASVSTKASGFVSQPVKKAPANVARPQNVPDLCSGLAPSLFCPK